MRFVEDHGLTALHPWYGDIIGHSRDLKRSQTARTRSARLKDKIASLREQIRRSIQGSGSRGARRPGPAESLTDPDARAMATNGKGTGWSRLESM